MLSPGRKGQAGAKPQDQREAGGGKAPRAARPGISFAHCWAPRAFRPGDLCVAVNCSASLFSYLSQVLSSTCQGIVLASSYPASPAST